MKQEQYLIHELAEKADVSVRTIRYYINEGLLPSPPSTQGRYAVFDEEHLHRLELIKRLKDAFLPLKEIRTRMNSLSYPEVLALLEQKDLGEPDQDRSVLYKQTLLPEQDAPSAREYIARLLDVHASQQSPEPDPSAGVKPAFPRSIQDLSSPLKSTREQPVPTEFWRHVSIAPGVEIHILEPAHPQDSGRIRKLIEFARQLFGSD